MNQGDNTTHIDNDTNIKDINNTINVDKNKTVNDTPIEVDKDKKDIAIENKSLNDTNSSPKLKDDCNMHDPQLCIIIDDVMYGSKPVAEIRSNESLNDYVEVTLMDSNSNHIASIANSKVAHGFGKYSFDKFLAPGNYTAVLNYYGDNIFNPCNASTNFTVKENDKIDPSLKVKVYETYLGENPIIHVKAIESFNRSVEVRLHNKIDFHDFYYTNVTLVNGEGNCTADTDLSPNMYQAVATFNGDDTYKYSSHSCDFIMINVTII